MNYTNEEKYKTIDNIEMRLTSFLNKKYLQYYLYLFSRIHTNKLKVLRSVKLCDTYDFMSIHTREYLQL